MTPRPKHNSQSESFYLLYSSKTKIISCPKYKLCQDTEVHLNLVNKRVCYNTIDKVSYIYEEGKPKTLSPNL